MKPAKNNPFNKYTHNLLGADSAEAAKRYNKTGRGVSVNTLRARHHFKQAAFWFPAGVAMLLLGYYFHFHWLEFFIAAIMLLHGLLRIAAGFYYWVKKG